MNHPLTRMKKRNAKKKRLLFENQNGSGNSAFPIKKYLGLFKDDLEKRNAFKLLKRLDKTSLHWSSKGELYNAESKKYISGSNIVVLIKHILRNNNSKPSGVKYFYKVLKHFHVPSYLVKNHRGRFLQKRRKKFRPPGELVSEHKTSNL